MSLPIPNANMSDAEKPERTREHYIDALGRNYVERFVLLRGHATDEPKPDYGYDIVITTFDYDGNDDFSSGEVENGSIYVQLKSTDKLKVGKKDAKKISFSIKRRPVVYWIGEPSPVILIVYSVADERAYWLHMQPYLKSSAFTMPPPSQEEVTVHLSTNYVVDEDAIKIFREYLLTCRTRLAHFLPCQNPSGTDDSFAHKIICYRFFAHKICRF